MHFFWVWTKPFTMICTCTCSGQGHEIMWNIIAKYDKPCTTKTGQQVQLTIFASSIISATLERFSRSHTVGVFVQRKQGPHCLSIDTYILDFVINSHASCSQSSHFPSFLYTEWGWHGRLIMFANVRIQQSIKNSVATVWQPNYSLMDYTNFHQDHNKWALPNCLPHSFTETIAKSITRQRLKQVPQ